MQGISSWVAGICAASLVVAVISAISPKNSAGRVCVMMASVMVMVALISPILDLRGLSLLDIGRDYERSIQRKIEETTEATERLKKDIIEEELSSYILDKAEVSEEACKVNIRLEDGATVSAEVVSRDSDTAMRVSEVLKDELEIEREEIKIEVG